MKIIVNGETLDWAEAGTVEELIRQHQLSPETALVELNGRAVRRRDWATQRLQTGDRLEILRVAAGG